MAFLARAISRPGGAEDIRDLQLERDKAAAYAGGGSVLLASVLVCGAFCCGFLGFLRGCASMSSGLLMLAIMPVATRV